MKGKRELVDPKYCLYKKYDSRYIKQFKKERNKIYTVLPKKIRIEHIGSTAVPGLGGKGAIDIAILATKEQAPRFIRKLERIGFVYESGRKSDKKSKYMSRLIGKGITERRVNLHLCVNKDFFDGYIYMREYLKSDRKIRDEYAKIKKEGSIIAQGDRKKYYGHKMHFLQENMKKAREIRLQLKKYHP